MSLKFEDAGPRPISDYEEALKACIRKMTSFPMADPEFVMQLPAIMTSLKLTIALLKARAEKEQGGKP